MPDNQTPSVGEAVISYLATISTEFWAAIIGAVVGGVFSMGLQLIAIRNERKLRQDERNNIRKNMGNVVLWKLMDISSNYHHLNKHIHDGFSQGHPESWPEPWSLVKAFASPPQEVYMTYEEIAFVGSLGNIDLTHNLSTLASRYNSQIGAFLTFCRLRTDLEEEMPKKLDGPFFVSELNEAELESLAPKMAVVNRLILDLSEIVDTNCKEAKLAAETLAKELNEEFGSALTIEYVHEAEKEALRKNA